MNKTIKKLTIDRAVIYQITVPGVVDALWIDEDSSVKITQSENDFGCTVSIITGRMDQAALQGYLRRLYSMGVPLISVILVDDL